MKKILLVLLLLFSFSKVGAFEIEYIKPKFEDINQYLTNSDIEPGYNPQPNDRIGVYEPYVLDGVDLITAEKYCSLKGEAYISYILEQGTARKRSALFYPDNATWWDYNRDIVRYAVITCDDGQVDAGTGTGEVLGAVVINNINADKGINKEIFDIETITEIYKYEGIIMVFIIFGTFINRVLGIRNKKRPMQF